MNDNEKLIDDVASAIVSALREGAAVEDWEALNALYWSHPDGHTTGLSEDAIDAILAAGFRRLEPRPCHLQRSAPPCIECSCQRTEPQVEPSEAQVEAGAKAIAAYQGVRYEGSLEDTWRQISRAALRAAGGVR